MEFVYSHCTLDDEITDLDQLQTNRRDLWN